MTTTTHPIGYSTTTYTPWGRADFAYKYAPGVICYSTPGHGGIHLSTKRNALVHPAWRRADGWYEEDCEFSIVALTFPHLFLDKIATHHSSARDYFPDAYSEVFGVEIPVQESYVLRQRKFDADHANDYVTTAARGRASWVPSGKVGVSATLGGSRRGNSETTYWLVDAERYTVRQGSYVVDPALDVRVGRID